MSRAVWILCSVALLAVVGQAQISPGELANSHKELEGIENCTKCHSIGKSIANANCLNCHTELRERITAKQGFHASLSSRQCVECHKDHHGRNFPMVKWEKNTFDHKQTGYTLEGKHAPLKCEKCHTADHIVDADIRKFADDRKQRTFLGLDTKCASCHKDEHRGQFTAECRQCHGMNGWKPAQNFSHDKARFVLTGAHIRTDCAKCHKKSWDHDAVTQYVKLEFQRCDDCHKDPHKGKFTQPCAQCHTTDQWRKVKAEAFDHNKTKFALIGKHAALKCEQCHPKDPNAANPSGEFGFHISKFQACAQCHADAHAKQFAHRKDGGRCEACHTEQGFLVPTFTERDHRLLPFQLLGAHLAVPCVKCHQEKKVVAKSTRQFHWEAAPACIVCHTDVHKGQFDKVMKNGCESCHTVEAWDAVTFAHEKTKFPLKGKHADLRCEKCHKDEQGQPHFTAMKMKCADCHEDPHAAQFATSDGTACEKCHTEQAWKSLVFDHTTQARFSLTGKHERVPCAKCHPEALINSIRTIKYKPLEAACIDCHPAQ